jgi:hypothetical protein
MLEPNYRDPVRCGWMVQKHFVEESRVTLLALTLSGCFDSGIRPRSA